MDKKESLCPICQKENIKVLNENIQNDIIKIQCERCGDYITSGTIIGYELTTLEWWEKRHIISAIIRELNILQNKPTFINFPRIENYLATYPIPVTPKEQADRLLFLISKKYDTLSKGIVLNYQSDYPLCYGKNENDLNYFISYLEEMGFIKHPPRGMDSWVITIEGWEYLNKINKGIYSNQAFVAMWFDDSMDNIYLNGIKPVLENLGFKPINMKFLDHSGKIDDRIIAEIRRSRLLIADVTGKRHSVLYEAGFAFGLNLPVIWTCKKSYFKYIKQIFDTRQYNHITWEKIEDLKEQLKNRIEVIIPNLPRNTKE